MVSLDRGNDRNIGASFIGATVSVLKFGDRNARPGLRLGLGIGHQPSSASWAFTQPRPAIVELGLASPEIGTVYLGGRRLGAAEGKGGLDTGEVFLIVAGIAASAFLVTQLTGSDDEDDDRDEERCLVEPWMCPQ
jgi:hypothetical protein